MMGHTNKLYNDAHHMSELNVEKLFGARKGSSWVKLTPVAVNRGNAK
jgi:hypothetical protein